MPIHSLINLYGQIMLSDKNTDNTIPRTDNGFRAGSVLIRFQLSTPKRKVSAVLCQISVNAQRAGRFVVEPKAKVVNWAQSLQKMLDDSPESTLLNDQLEFIRIEIKRIALRMQLEGKPISAQLGSSRVDLQACKLEYSIVSPK